MDAIERRRLLADYNFFEGAMAMIDDLAKLMDNNLLYGAGLRARGIDISHPIALLRAAIQPEFDAINERFEAEDPADV